MDYKDIDIQNEYCRLLMAAVLTIRDNNNPTDNKPADELNNDVYLEINTILSELKVLSDKMFKFN